MKILSVTAKNLLSFSDLHLEFKDSGLTLVEGWNYDDERANGAGKTAIFNLICLGIYEKLPRKINISEVLKHGEKKGSVEVRVLQGSNIYTAKYERPKKRSFKKNGEECDISQQEFESIIGLGYEQFLASMYTAQGGGNKFLNLNDSGKKDFLLSLMNLNDFSIHKKTADKKVKEIGKKIDEINVKVEKAKSKIEAYTDSCVKEEDVIYEIECAQADIVDLNKDILKNQQVQKPDLSKFYELESKINSKKSQFISLRTTRSQLSREFSSLDAKASAPFVADSPDANCPSCTAELRVRGKSLALMEDQEALKKQHDQHVSEIRKQMKELKTQIDDIDSKLHEEKSVKVLEQKMIEKRDKERQSYDKAKSAIMRAQYAINEKNNRIDSLKEKLKNNEEYVGKIMTLQKFIENSDEVLAKLLKEQEEYKAVSQMFSPTGAPAYMMDTIIETFNHAVTEHILSIWPSASYELKSHKENSTGDVVAKFSESLVIAGKSMSIGGLSGGENRAFSLAVDFAVIDVLSQQFGMPLSPIVMDEPFEGLDAAGREFVIELLEKLSADRQILVVDHASESKAMFSEILRVEKRNGTSKIVSS